MDTTVKNINSVSGGFVDLAGERFYAVHNVDKMPPFFISVVSNSDHWMFVSSNGGLTAGRVSPETALFPYVTVDKVHESSVHTGSKTLLRIRQGESSLDWEPFNMDQDGRYQINRHLYKNILGNKLCFEEVNHDLDLVFRYTWMSSERFGFVRHCELQNKGEQSASVEMLDGLQNILPAGTPRFTQTNSSNLVDAYKWSELEAGSGVAFFTLYSGITDRPEPCESLMANTVFCVGLEDSKILISSQQMDHFRLGEPLHQEFNKRGVRGAYLVNKTLQLAPGATQHWQLVANIEQTQAQVVELCNLLKQPAKVGELISQSVDSGSDELARIMAASDGFQLIAEESVSVHHYANVLFNILRGGAFDDQYQVTVEDFTATIKHFNKTVFQRHQGFFSNLPERLKFDELLAKNQNQNDHALERLTYEYLPITFGRRHGDPSRPWNQFAIRLKDEQGNRLLSYQGNWRDIFQNWEALSLSYPEFIENMIAKFVNASTIDGYNPYRITKEGIDWEVEEEDDPWSYIGYWGDHQIIYLLKLLELSNNFHPSRLGSLLRRPIFSYANVPYRIRPFESLLQDPKNTVDFDDHVAERLEQQVSHMGADGKLLLDSDGEVYQVNLLEKLLIPLLSKLGNLVIDGGIWLNTQRPEWNDANNALVGQGLSMVTLYYLRRYVHFLQQFLAGETESFELSKEVSLWLIETSDSLARVRPLLGKESITATQRYQTLTELGQAASRYRQTVYQQHHFSDKVLMQMAPVMSLLDDALIAIDHSIASNQRDDQLYHAYNLLDLKHNDVAVGTLYPMLEGQVAALSAGSLDPQKAISVLQTLFDSNLYRPGQQSFMLYPDRELPGFLQKNCVPDKRVEAIPLLQTLLAKQDESIILRDPSGIYRFNAELINSTQLGLRLDQLAEEYAEEVEAARKPLKSLYEDVFNHQEFTGRSGGMFGFEGLGCIYWHMVSKLLLVVQENYFAALDQSDQQTVLQQLGELYYQVRHGIGFNKSPAEYGAFPTDPYSHTPKHAGARQPGMTGQVKEELLTRFGELGVRVREGCVRFQPSLLRLCEFAAYTRPFRYLDVMNQWQDIDVPAAGLAFTWCQVPIVYRLDDDADPGLVISWADGSQQAAQTMQLSAEQSNDLFLRNGRIQQMTLTLNSKLLFDL